MWILPSTIFPSAPGTAASTSDSEQFSRIAERSLMWRSKHSPARTWSQRWNRVNWIRHLSGRIFTPSTHDHTRDTSGFCLEAFLANHSVKQAADAQTKTLVTSFRRSNASSTNADPGASSWKTSRESFLPGFEEPQRQAYSCMSWTDWRLEVTRRRGDCSARRNAAHRTDATASSSLRWPTATVGDSMGTRNATANRTKGGHHSGTTLTDAITIWPTPTAHLAQEGAYPAEFTRNTISLTAMAQPIENWPTPTTAEAGKISNRPNKGQIGLSNHPSIQGECTREPLNKSRGGQQDQDRSSTIGKSQGQLNPAWVEQLMGLPPGWTDLDF